MLVITIIINSEFLKNTWLYLTGVQLGSSELSGWKMMWCRVSEDNEGQGRCSVEGYKCSGAEDRTAESHTVCWCCSSSCCMSTRFSLSCSSWFLLI